MSEPMDPKDSALHQINMAVARETLRRVIIPPAGGVMAPETVGHEPVDSQSMSSPVQRSEPKTCSGSTSNG